MNRLENESFRPAPAEYFTGKAFVKTIVAADVLTNCNISEVAFDAGSRNHWHTHPSNQILMIKEGTCYYQEEGGLLQKVNPGEVINILPGVKHWHGASPNEPMFHIAININTDRGMVNWMEAVTEEVYSR